jgi:hypothetical protein
MCRLQGIVVLYCTILRVNVVVCKRQRSCIDLLIPLLIKDRDPVLASTEHFR